MGCGSSTQASPPGKKPAEVIVEPVKAGGVTASDKPHTPLYASTQAQESSPRETPNLKPANVETVAEEVVPPQSSREQAESGPESQRGNPGAKSITSAQQAQQEQSQSMRKSRGSENEENPGASRTPTVDRSLSAWQPADPIVNNHMKNSVAVFSAEIPPAHDWAPEYTPENVVPPHKNPLATYSSRGTRTSMANLLQKQQVQRKVK
jgi:hypothetical protein